MRLVPLLACLALAAPALAQDQAAPAEKPLYRFPGLPDPRPLGDAKRDPRKAGQLFIAPSGQPFRAERGQPYPVVVWFAQADTDHDGKIDRPEFEADFERFFGILDINHDQVVDAAEINRYETRLVPEIHAIGISVDARGARGGHRRGGYGGGSFGGGFGGGHGGAPALAGEGQDGGAPAPGSPAEPPAGAGWFGLISNPEPVSSMDINLDGSVSTEEMRSAARRRFTLLDSDRRFYLTLRDLPETPAQRGRLFRRGR